MFIIKYRGGKRKGMITNGLQMTSRFHTFSMFQLNSMLYSWTCLKMYLQYAQFIPFSKIESLELLFYIYNIYAKKFWRSKVSLYSSHVKHPFPKSQVPFITLCFCTCCYLQGRIFLLSVWPSSLVLQVLCQMSPSRVGNSLSCAQQ